jgi:hypothetical protein
MASDNAPARGASPIKLDPADILFDPMDNGRWAKSDPKLQELGEKLLSDGRQFQPVGVVRLTQLEPGSTARYRLVWGSRRLRAIQWLNELGLVPESSPLRQVEAKMVSWLDGDDPKALFLANVSENVGSAGLSTMDKAAIVERLLDFNMPNAEIAGVLGLDDSRVSQLKALMRLPEGAKQLLADGIISAAVGYEISLQPASELKARIAEIKATGKASRASVREAYNPADELENQVLSTPGWNAKPTPVQADEPVGSADADESADDGPEAPPEPPVKGKGARKRARTVKQLIEFLGIFIPGDTDKPEYSQVLAEELARFMSGVSGERRFKNAWLECTREGAYKAPKGGKG